MAERLDDPGEEQREVEALMRWLGVWPTDRPDRPLEGIALVREVFGGDARLERSLDLDRVLENLQSDTTSQA